MIQGFPSSSFQAIHVKRRVTGRYFTLSKTILEAEYQVADGTKTTLESVRLEPLPLQGCIQRKELAFLRCETRKLFDEHESIN